MPTSICGTMARAMKLETWAAPEGEAIPNHPRFAVLVYRGVADAMDGATACRALFGRHGWGGAWIDGVFDFHHFHSTSHEVLGVVRGAATLELGGPQDRAFDVEAGDVVVLPAGTGHRRATGRDGFQVVGAYPAGQEDYDLLRAADQAARDRIVALPPPPEDPVGGDGIATWRRASP
jgi:uncharacterized protein YjlB